MAAGLRLQQQRGARGSTERDHGYWRDVGTLDAFYDAHMDLVSVHPVFHLYNKRWPIRGESENLAPAKFVNGGSAQESVVGAGSIISAASVRNSVLSFNVKIDDGVEHHEVGRRGHHDHAVDVDAVGSVGDGELPVVAREHDPLGLRPARCASPTGPAAQRRRRRPVARRRAARAAAAACGPRPSRRGGSG